MQYDDDNVKIQKAQEWRIPVLTDTWLEDCAAAGRWIGTEPELIEDTHMPPPVRPSKPVASISEKSASFSAAKPSVLSNPANDRLPSAQPQPVTALAANTDSAEQADGEATPLDQVLSDCIICTSSKLSVRV